VTEELTLRLPFVGWPYYWCLEVRQNYIYVGVKRRWMFLFTTALSWKVSEAVEHKGHLTQDALNEIEGKAQEMAKQVNPVRDVLKQFRREVNVVPLPGMTIQIKKD
jgi:hypothetical protein